MSSLPQLSENAAPPKKRPWLRFSLCTLVVFVLLIGSVIGLRSRWEPWAVECQLELPDEYIHSAVYSPDGSTIVTLSEQNDPVPSAKELVRVSRTKVSLWDTAHGLCKKQVLLHKVITSWRDISFSPHGNWIIARAHEWGYSRMRLIDAATGKDVFPQDVEIENLKYTADERYFLVVYAGESPFGSTDREPEIWDMNLRQPIKTVSLRFETLGATVPDTRSLRDAVLSPDGRYISDGYRCIWDVASGTCVTQFEMGAISWYTPFLLDGHRVIVKDGDSTRIYNLDTKKIETTIPGKFIEGSLSPDGSKLLTAIQDAAHPPTATVNVFDVRSGKELYSAKDISIDLSVEAIGVRWGERGPVMIRLRASTSIDLQTGVATTFVGQLSPDWSRTVSGGGEIPVSVFVEKCASALRGSAGGYGGAFAPDSRHLLTAKDSCVKIWHRRRPECWWGLAWLPEFWLTLLFACVLAWSLRRDRRVLRIQLATSCPT